ncbi:class I adenylate-forming enzyme family protein [Pseudonocardia sp. CA-107938]|uniref:class I adenylate-forming enzyme family protein n=1 Tax=Pseudonocardia sp. CA-107938 TaxID=3240021 RepID=UPI003D8CAE37
MPDPDGLTVRASTHPDRTAIIDPAGATLTYAELEARANRLAHALLDQGVLVGDRVAWCGPNAVEVLVVLHACRKIGAIAVPVAYRFTDAELGYVLADSGAVGALVDPGYVDRIAALRPQLPALRELVAWGTPAWDALLAAGSPEPPAPAEAAGTQMIYTSGTTGKPKGAVRARPVPEMTDALVRTLRLVPDDEVHLTTGPLYHSGPLAWAVLTHAIGGTVVVMRSFDPARWLELVRTYRVTNTFTAPTPLKRIVALPDDVLATADLTSMRSLVANAAPVPYALKQEIVAKLGDGFLFEVYGSTELGVSAVLPPEEQLARPGSCGLPLPGTEMRVVGEDGHDLPPGAPGKLLVRSPSTFFGYHGRSEPVGDADGWKTVGDVAHFDADGYLYIRDRGGDLVITGGMNVYPAEVEAVLHAHPDVLDVAVFGVPSAEWGQSVHAAVVARPGHTVDVAALEAHVAGQLAGYKRPRSWEVRDSLPRTDSGKILKRVLREEYDTRTAAGNG